MFGKQHDTEVEIMNNTVYLNKTKFQEFSNSAAFFCAIAFMIFIPINIVLMNVFLFLVLIFTLMAGDLKHHLTLVWRNPVTKVALMLFALLSIGVFWSIAETDWSLRVLKNTMSYGISHSYCHFSIHHKGVTLVLMLF